MMIKSLALMTTALGLLAANSVQAADVTGFRSAHFGADEKTVIAAATADLNVKPADIQHVPDDATKTTVLMVKMKTFPPFNLPATVGYVLGYQCKCLTQVHVVWTVDGASTGDRTTALNAVGALVQHFTGEGWDKDETITNRVTGDVKEGSENVIVFFRGQHKTGAAITLAGGPVKMMKPAKSTGAKDDALAANIDGLKEFSLSYDKDAVNPDVYHVDVTGF